MPRTKKLRRRRSLPVTSVSRLESPLEERRVLSAVTAAAVMDHTDAGSAQDSGLVSASQQGATALIVNGQSTSDYEAVGVVNGGCTGTLIAPDMVLTAAHCVESQNGGFIGDTEGTFTVNGQTYRTTKVTVHPSYNPNNFGAGYDIAIMKLERPVDGVTPYDINRTTPQVGQMLTLVGFGETGSSTSGSYNDFGNKTVGQTAIDEVSETHISWNFDSHDESNTAPGDSGGPAFVEQNGQLVVAGVTSGGDGDPHSLGDFSFDTRVDTLAAWIDQVAGTTGGGTGGGGSDGGGSGGDGTDGGSSGNQGSFTNDQPVAIPDDAVATVTSQVAVSGLAGSITDVNVSLDIAHTWNEDLTVTLISPSGTRIELFDAVGGDSDNFVNTTLDDQAAVRIGAAAAPFTGTFRPVGSLDRLNGEDPNGQWTLEVTDHFEADGGQISRFTVSITTDAPADGGDGGNGSDGGTGGDGGDSLAQQAIDVDREWELSTTGNYFEDWGGRGEKWMTSNNGWTFITPDGSLYRWSGSGATGQLIATFSPAYHADPALLHEAYDNSQGDSAEDLAAKAIEIDQQYDLRTTGDLWEDWSGQGEKWLYSNVGWMYVTPDGGLFEFAGNDDGTDRLIYQFSAEYHQDVSLLYNAYDNSQRDKRSADSLFEDIAAGCDDLLVAI